MLSTVALMVVLVGFAGQEDEEKFSTLYDASLQAAVHGDRCKAADYGEQALKLLQKLKRTDTEDYAVLASNTGLHFSSIGEHRKAHAWLVEALAVKKQRAGVGHAGYRKTLLFMSIVFLDVGLVDESERSLRFVREGDLKDNPEALENGHMIVKLGECLLANGKGEECHKRLEEAAKCFDKLGKDTYFHVDVFRLRGMNALLMRQPEKAKEYFTEAERIRLKRFPDDTEMALRSHVDFARLYHETGAADKAKNHLTEADKLEAKQGHFRRDTLLDKLRLSGDIYSGTDPKKAEDYFQKALAFSEKEFGQEGEQTVRSLSAYQRFLTLRKRNDEAAKVNKKVDEIRTRVKKEFTVPSGLLPDLPKSKPADR